MYSPLPFVSNLSLHIEDELANLQKRLQRRLNLVEFVNIIWNALHTVHQLGSAQPALIRHCNYLEYVLILPQSETQYLVVSFPTYAELFRELE